MTARSREEIRSDIRRLGGEPYGPAYTARAEALTAEAESTGDRSLLIKALERLVSAYSFSSEGPKMLVPFSRLLRMWDERPDDFDSADVHGLHWKFKWVSGDAIRHPDVTLDAVEGLLADMLRRYRLAGHSERPAHGKEFEFAAYLGDAERAERARSAMLAADRDRMADCRACEVRELGKWEAEQNRDEAAVDAWAPVLDGGAGCLHEPHYVLSYSLLPLVRLGRADQARGHHLRGYRLVRSEEALTEAVAAHMEFCALTGNEARGLEILGEQAQRWEQHGDLVMLMEWAACAALLMRRVAELGHGDRPVPGPKGREWTCAALLEHARGEALAIAGRYDRRNGSTAVSERIRARMDAGPLLEELPLGLSGPALRKARVPVPPAPAVPGAGPAARLAEARRLSEAGHPAAPEAWRLAERAFEAAGAEPSPGERAEIGEGRALGLPAEPGTAASLEEAAGLYERARDRGRAVVARARAVLVRAAAGERDGVSARMDELCAEAERLHAAGGATGEQAVAVPLFRGRLRLALLGEEEDPAQAAAALDADLDRLAGFARGLPAGPAVRARIADVAELRGRLAVPFDPEAALLRFADAAEGHRESGRTAQAAADVLLIARLRLERGEPQAAEAAARSVHGDPERAALLGPGDRAELPYLLGRALMEQGRSAEEAGALFLESMSLHVRAGGTGASAQLELGRSLMARDRFAEAATTLEDLLPNLSPEYGEEMRVQARVWLAHCHRRTGDPGAAAEQFALAADATREWPDGYRHAELAHEAAGALSAAGLPAEAVRAYRRALELWRGLGEEAMAVRALRARAWEALEAEGAGAAEEAMAEALRANEAAVSGAGEGEERDGLRGELGQTHMQRARLSLRRTDGVPDEEVDSPEQYAVNVAATEEALGRCGAAAEAFAALGPAGERSRLEAEDMAARMELALGRFEAAGGRAARMRAAVQALPDGDDRPALLEACDAVAEAARSGSPFPVR
ncbi:hypothetical protein J0910_06285 [Nocardiopsis sp. CNT-189]|uniref:hypothetical protein n=1 Tax=Nocardiopsis oceanisediminis TaxID=2816862 RepID=UPI003B3133FE